MLEIDNSGKIFIVGDLNGHIGNDGRGYERIYRGHGHERKMSLVIGYQILRRRLISQYMSHKGGV